MGNAYQSDFDRIKPKYWSSVVSQLQTKNIPAEPLTEYYKCLQTLKYLVSFDPENPTLLAILEKYEIILNNA